MEPRGAVAERVHRVGADDLGDDEHAPLGPPQRALAPAREVEHADHAERAAGHRVGEPQVRDAEPRGERRAVAVVAVQELDHAGRLPSAVARSIASGMSTGSISQTPSPVSSAWLVRVMASFGHQEKPNGKSS